MNAKAGVLLGAGTLAAALLVASILTGNSPVPETDATLGAAQPIPESEVELSIQDTFSPSGFMGDGEFGDKYVVFEGSHKEKARSEPDCIRITYTFGPKTWAGIYWLNLPDNWGDEPGNDYSTKSYRKLAFYARGSKGGEVVEFKSGGVRNAAKPYRDSDFSNIGRQTLTTEWQRYEIDLSGKDLSSVIGGFCWAASANYNKGSQIQFFLDDIELVR